jgi:NTE family protein
LVLGGGGVLGAAWMIGALDALERSRGIDARQADLIIGTSAGSVIGALLSAGVSVADQLAQQVAQRTSKTKAGEAGFDPDRAAGSGRPPRPRLRPGSTAILRNNRGSLRQIPRTALLAGLAPTGRGKLAGVAELIEAVVPAGQWTSNPGYRAVVLDYETGRRVVFGAPDAPPAGLSEAVLASCAIPGWFEPVTIGGRRYVDGGMWSPTNVDLLAGAGLDEVFVLAPMVSAAYDTPGDWRTRVERRVRVANTRRCLAEARKVHLGGTAVTVLGPGPEDLELMGYNLMAPSRRRVVLESAIRTGLTAFADPPPLPTPITAKTAPISPPAAHVPAGLEQVAMDVAVDVAVRDNQAHG